MWAWLVKVESMGGSFSLYVPIVILTKIVVYARVFLLTWFIGTDQFGVWGLGVMVFGITSTISTLGSNQSIARYVSFYQARGRLRAFLHRAALGICLTGLTVAVLGVMASRWIAELLGVSDSVAVHLPFDLRLDIVLLGLLNGVLMALYLNLHSCIRGMRIFRLLVVIEVGYVLLFTTAALVAVATVGSGVAILWAHAGSLAVMLLVGGFAVHRCLTYIASSKPDNDEEILSIGEEGDIIPTDSQVSQAERTDQTDEKTILYHLFQFGFVAMLATLVWQCGHHVGRLLTNHFHGLDEVGVYAALSPFCQPVWILSGMVWGVVFSHLVNHWESNKRQAALDMLNLTYKAVVLTLMTLTVLILVTGRWWRLMLHESYQTDIRILSGLLMFYQCSANMGLASVAAKLRERPMVITVVIAVGVVVNIVLGYLWIPEGGAMAAARAAGIGMLVAVALGVVYLIITGFRIHPSAHVLALTPALLLAPTTFVAIAWAAILTVALFTHVIFTVREKRVLFQYIRTLGMRRRRGQT